MSRYTELHHDYPESMMEECHDGSSQLAVLVEQ